MIAARGLASPDPGQLRACAFAAAAEGGLLAFPTHLLLDAARTMGIGVSAFTLGFVVAYVVAAALVCGFRTSRNVTAAAAVLAVLAGVTLGGGGIDRTAFTVVVALLVGLRVVSLGGRDWRTPVEGELGWWAAILGVETLIAAGPLPEWRPALLVVVPAAFGGAIASRATTVWSGVASDDDQPAASWVRRSLAATGAVAAGMVLTVVLAARGGLFGLIGRWLRPLTEVAAGVLIWLAAQAARPVFWLAQRLGIDPEGIREALERMRTAATRDRPPSELVPPGSSPWQRVLGLLIFAAIGYLLFRVLRRWLSRAEPDRPAVVERRVAISREAAPERVDPPPRWRFRAELPADAVRRLYAEVLLDLRERRMVKEPSLTPAEFVPIVAAEFPQCADDFGALTRSYQHVRYGNMRLDRGEVRELESRQRRLLGMLRRPGHGPVTRKQ